MIRVIVVGCNGNMGRVLDEVIGAEETMEIVAGVDQEEKGLYPYPIFTSVAECPLDADAVIDFSVSKITDQVLDDCVSRKLPLVLCTTGLSPLQLAHVDAAAKEIPIVQSYNMSLGINTMIKLLCAAAPILAEAGFDIEIIEKHHNQKVDAPSGTAILLAERINDVMDQQYYYKYDRTVQRQKRDKKEIGISAVRGGTIVGEHEVIFAGTDEVLSITHEAHSKAVFAKGAIQAVRFLLKKNPGRYTMSDVIA